MKYFLLTCVALLGITPLAPGAAPGSEEHLREYTREFDSMDSLKAWPMDRRPTAAIITAISYMELYAATEAKRLEELRMGEDLALQKRELRAAAVSLVKLMNCAAAIEDQWKPEMLSQEQRARLAKLREVIGTFKLGISDNPESPERQPGQAKLREAIGTPELRSGLEVDDKEYRVLYDGMREIAKGNSAR